VPLPRGDRPPEDTDRFARDATWHHSGLGATQRLPRLIGLQAALDIICKGKSVSADKARRIGLVDAAVPSVVAGNGETVALGSAAVRRKSVKLQNMWPMRPIACRFARKKVSALTRGQYPAPLRAIDAVEQGVAGKKLDAGLEGEAKIFGEVSATPVCKSLIRIFFLREKYSKLTFDTERVERTGPISARVATAPIEKSGCSARV